MMDPTTKAQTVHRWYARPVLFVADVNRAARFYKGRVFVELTAEGLTETFAHMFPLRFLPALALIMAPAVASAQQSPARPQPERVQQSQSSHDAFFGRRSQLPGVADTVVSRAMVSTCPMPVARPDTTRLERMPRVRLDSAKMAPMPVAHGCLAVAK